MLRDLRSTTGAVVFDDAHRWDVRDATLENRDFNIVVVLCAAEADLRVTKLIITQQQHKGLQRVLCVCSQGLMLAHD